MVMLPWDQTIESSCQQYPWWPTWLCVLVANNMVNIYNVTGHGWISKPICSPLTLKQQVCTITFHITKWSMKPHQHEIKKFFILIVHLKYWVCNITYYNAKLSSDQHWLCNITLYDVKSSSDQHWLDINPTLLCQIDVESMSVGASGKRGWSPSLFIWNSRFTTLHFTMQTDPVSVKPDPSIKL